MENKTFIQLNTLPTGYNGFAMTADFPCSEEGEYSRTSEAENYSVKYVVVPIADGHRNSVGCTGTIKTEAEYFCTSSQKYNATV